jgi:hypothetical protein
MSAADVTVVRFARPTDRLPDLLRFYEDGLGLERIDSFEDPDCWRVVLRYVDS